jgi:SAM-dependent methyltransferase
MTDHLADLERHYVPGLERDRLVDEEGEPRLELVRSLELLQRFLPPAPADVLDVGGGPGTYAARLARDGYRLVLVDLLPSHVDEARADGSFEAEVGDARRLDREDGSFDAVLLMGPLYHLTERGDRLAALREAHRVLRPGGRLIAVAISRFASLLDGLTRNRLDPRFWAVIERDLRDGQHRTPDPDRPEWFTTAYFHHPDELRAEVAEAGFRVEALLGIEGPAWLVEQQWADRDRREKLLFAARAVEAEPSVVGVSSHILAAAVK